MTVIQSTLLSILIGSLNYIYAEEIAYAYTQDPDTVFLLERCLRSCAISIALLGFLCSLQGTLKALQKQKLASRILLVCLYAISLPISYILSIELEIGVTGLWTGFAAGQTCITVLYIIVFLRTSWQEVFEINRERKRLEAEQ